MLLLLSVFLFFFSSPVLPAASYWFWFDFKVGDNVGDCAARGADLFESIAAEIISAMILGGTMAQRCKIEGKCLVTSCPYLVYFLLPFCLILSCMYDI